MSGNIRIENVLIQVTCRLMETRINLSVSPYYEEDIGPIDDEIEKLAVEYSQILNIPLNYCRAAISELQNKSLDNKRHKKEFDETGVATIKVRVPNQVGGTRLITVKIKLSDTGRHLQEVVANKLEICPTRVKLINAGKVINYNQILSDQNIRCNGKVMTIISDSSEAVAESVAQSLAYDRVQKARDDAQLLLDRTSFLQIADQQGNVVHVPPKEGNMIRMGLALYEKAKVEMKKKNYSEALLFLLEADNEFSQCRSELLDSSDNAARLNLDIVWCYLCLKSVSELPSAEERLRKCEAKFEKSYGTNLNRVVEIKKNAGNEKALIMRLHLLQAIVSFLKNNRYESQNLLALAETELNQLKISQESVTALVDMGYTEYEARVALRACGGSIDQAISSIIETRCKQEEGRKQSRKEHHLMDSIGKSKDKNWVNPRTLCTLVDMGFRKELCVSALQLTDNNMDQAIDMLQNNQAELQRKASEDFIPNTTVVDRLTKMGFPSQLVDVCLREASNNMEEAVEAALRMQSDGSYEAILANVLGSTSGASTSSVAAQIVENIQNSRPKNHKETEEARERLAEGMSNDDDDYLDFSMVMEESLIAEYKKFLGM